MTLAAKVSIFSHFYGSKVDYLQVLGKKVVLCLIISKKVSIFATINKKNKIMAKYNITEKKEHRASYPTTISPVVMDELHSKILQVLLIDKKYRDKDYSAKQLALDLGTNSRYISAVINLKFHMNYATLVNTYRIEEAMSILVDKRYLGLTMEEVACMVGFANRQSFYAAFYKLKNSTPRDYKMQYLEQHPEITNGGKKKAKSKK